MLHVVTMASGLLPDSTCKLADLSEAIATDRLYTTALALSGHRVDPELQESMASSSMHLYASAAAKPTPVKPLVDALTWVTADANHAMSLYVDPEAYPASARHTWYLERCYLSD